MSRNLIEAAELDKLQLITTQANRTTELETLCWSILEWVEELTGVEDCVVYLKLGNMLTQVAGLGVKQDENAELVSRIGLPLGVGIVGSAAQEGRSIYAPDVSKDPRYVFDEFHGKSEFCSIMLHRDQVVGAIDTEHAQVDGISEKNRQLIQAISLLVAPHVAALLHTSGIERPDLSEVIADLAQLPASGSLRSRFANITERASRTLHVSRANVWLVTDENSMTCMDMFELASEQHTCGATLDRAAFPAYFSALQDERVIIAHDAATDPRTAEFYAEYLKPNDIKSMLDAPIWQDGELAGVICLEHQHVARRWTQEEASFVATLADLLTIALISDRRSTAETALIHAQKMESLGRLAGGIAHDFNNLLTVISGAVETLQARLELDDTSRRLTKLVVDASNRASRLTKNLLAFGGNQPLELVEISSDKLCQNIQALVGDIIREDIELRFHHPVKPILTRGDMAQLEQVLLNLILNAVDALPRGGLIAITITQQQDSAVAIAVEDNGVGMDADVQKRIFDPFFTTKGEHGTGLGLSVCQGIIRQHKGTLICTSEPGRGSRFEITLPLINTTRSRASDHPDEHITRAREQGCNILLVEDETGVRTVVTQMLDALGYEVEVAENAREALQVLDRGHIDILLTDVVMPDMRGPEIYQQISTRQTSLRALFISGYTDDVLQEIPLREHQVAYLAKPFSLAQLQSSLASLMPPATTADETRPAGYT